MWFFKLIIIVATAYFAIVALIYFAQTRLLFPAGIAAAGATALPPSAARLEVETQGGDRLIGVHVPPAQTTSEDRPPSEERFVVLGFGGNAWNAQYLAAYLHDLFPEIDVVAFHYRGYRPSTGRPGAAALLADASLVHDHVVATLGTGRVIAAGFSIGSGVAAHLASRRPLAGVILVSPFDSLEALASGHYPWAPVRWLLRHHMYPAQDLRGLTTPIALIASQRDTVVPPARTEALRKAIPAPILDCTIARADHNDLYDRPEFRAAMAEALTRIKQAAD